MNPGAATLCMKSLTLRYELSCLKEDGARTLFLSIEGIVVRSSNKILCNTQKHVVTMFRNRVASNFGENSVRESASRKTQKTRAT